MLSKPPGSGNSGWTSPIILLGPVGWTTVSMIGLIGKLMPGNHLPDIIQQTVETCGDIFPKHSIYREHDKKTTATPRFLPLGNVNVSSNVTKQSAGVTFSSPPACPSASRGDSRNLSFMTVTLTLLALVDL